MFPLRCTVRNCQRPLVLSDRALRCDANHHFDQARQGYWSLLQPQDRRSLQAGDADSATLARRRWLQQGHADGLIDLLRQWIDRTDDQDASIDCDAPHRKFTLELGCGEGTIARQLFADTPSDYCGIDLSRSCVKLAARLWPAATWVLANADRTLPASDGCVSRVVSLFGRRPIEEIRRILRPGGCCLIAVPGAEDLIELREHIQNAGHRRDRTQAIVDEMNQSGLFCVDQTQWKHQLTLTPEQMADALAMTYRGSRHSQQQRAQNLAAMTVTVAADLMLFRRGPV